MKFMFIIDNKGKKIEVTHLDAAIKQVDVFVNYSHEDPAFRELDVELKEYWTDVKNKLIALKQNKTNGNGKQ